MKNPQGMLSKLLSKLTLILGVALLPQSISAANYALRTSGPGSYFRTWGSSSSLTPAKTFTIEVWVKPTGAGSIFNEVDAFTEGAWDYNLAEINSNGDVLIGHRSAQASHLGNIAYMEKRRLAFDIVREKIMPL